MNEKSRDEFGFGDFESESDEEERLREERRKRMKLVEEKHQKHDDSDGNGASDCGEKLQKRTSIDKQYVEQHVTSSVPPVSQGSGGVKRRNEPNNEVDIFADSPVDGNDGRRVTREQLLYDEVGVENGYEHENVNLQSNWDDCEGYYRARAGELIGGYYRSLGVIGKGVFSTVLDCVDIRTRIKEMKKEKTTTTTNTKDGDEAKMKHVAVKLIRNNDVMRKAAEKEITILTTLAKHDSLGKKYCVTLLDSLDYRRHVVLVFDLLRMNLREAVKKYGSNQGINLDAVRLYSCQLISALQHMAAVQVVHADIKPDNILVSEDLQIIKICDFGSAFRETDFDAGESTPYLVSRFYRAPEIILGLPYDRRLDLWSVAVCIGEICSGKVLFPGSSNNDMLKLFMNYRGPFPGKIIKAHLRAYNKLEMQCHFTEDLRFKQVELDAVTKEPILRIVQIIKAKHHLSSCFDESSNPDDRNQLDKLVDLLNKMLELDPKKRISLEHAIAHPFCGLTNTNMDNI
jgi:serine/threonine-protein kinase PRP4